MKKTFVFLMTMMLLSCNVCASTDINLEVNDDVEYDTAVPYYIGISTVSNKLDISSTGSATCYANTKTLSGYTAKVKVELQKKNNSWETIKTWTDTNSVSATVSKSYSVSKGYSYRLKTTHSSIDSDGNVVESFTMYSSTKSY